MESQNLKHFFERLERIERAVASLYSGEPSRSPGRLGEQRDRLDRILEHYARGATINHTSELTGIPRTTVYRLLHPEYREREKEKQMERYRTDPEYRAGIRSYSRKYDKKRGGMKQKNWQEKVLGVSMSGLHAWSRRWGTSCSSTTPQEICRILGMSRSELRNYITPQHLHREYLKSRLEGYDRELAGLVFS